MAFYDFEAIKASTDILQVAQDLGLTLRKSGAGFRSPCLACKGGDQRGLVITPGKGYFCFSSMKGGDVLGMVAHLLELHSPDGKLDNKAAAAWLTETYSLGTVQEERTVKGTVQSQEPGQAAHTTPVKEHAAFDPDAYAAKLTYNEQVSALGISEEDAARLSIGYASTGLHRGRVAFPVRNTDGSIAGFVSAIDLKVPTKWQQTTVVPFQKRA